MKLSEDVAGATFLAVGSAAPEIVINVVGVVRSLGDSSNCTPDVKHCNDKPVVIGVSAIIGSGLVAFCLCPGLCGLLVKENLVLKRRPILRDAGFYLLIVALLASFTADSTIEWFEGFILMLVYIAYLVVVVMSSKVRARWLRKKYGITVKHKSFVAGADESDDEDLAGGNEHDEYEGLLPGAVVQNLNHENDETEMDDWSEEKGATAVKNSQVEGEGAGSPPPGFGTYDVPEVRLLEEDLDDMDDDDEDDDEDELPETPLGWAYYYITYPLMFAMKYTCPECEHQDDLKRTPPRYPITVISSFAWVSVFSFLVSTIIDRWSTISGISPIILGMSIVALGGEIPDTMQSVVFAKKGYGSLAVANALGSKVVNIGVGLGLPWTIAAASGRDIVFSKTTREDLRAAVLIHLGGVVVFLAITVGYAYATKAHKAGLFKLKGLVLLATYVALVSGFIGYKVSRS